MKNRSGIMDLHSENVGYAIRDGQIVLVVLDLGL